jgi:periplasmic divalent cation tolerance protein
MIQLVLTTVANAQQADDLAQTLVRSALAACVTQLPKAKSTYTWDGKLETSDEILLLIKTHANKLQELKVWLESHHPYDCPEVLAFNAVDGLEAYMHWVAQQTSQNC